MKKNLPTELGEKSNEYYYSNTLLYSKPTILVTGGTGSLGYDIIKVATNYNYKVKCLVHDFKASSL